MNLHPITNARGQEVGQFDTDSKTYMKCTKCGHEWKPNVEKPLACPKCKRYDYQ